jgi:hypothetical protein
MILQIKALLTQRRKPNGKIRSASHIQSEIKLLFNEAVNHLTAIIDRTADDDFPLRYHNVINLRHNRAHYYNHIDLFEILALPTQSLVISQPEKRDDVIWTSGEKEVPKWRNGFWPFPVNASKLVVPPHKRHFRRTRDEVLVWDRVAVMVPDSNVQALVRLLRKASGGVTSIVAADEGVCVVFRIEAQDYKSWQQMCRLLHRTLAGAGVHAEKISLQTLVPISRESRGRGALLFLA